MQILFIHRTGMIRKLSLVLAVTQLECNALKIEVKGEIEYEEIKEMLRNEPCY